MRCAVSPAAVTGDPLNSAGFCAPTADRMVVGTSSNRMTPSHLVEDADRKLAVGLLATRTTPTPSQGRDVDGSPTSTTRTTASAGITWSSCPTVASTALSSAARAAELSAVDATVGQLLRVV